MALCHVDYCDVWILILTAPIHCRGSPGEQVMLKLLQIASKEKKIFGGGGGFSIDFHPHPLSLSNFMLRITGP